MNEPPPGPPENPLLEVTSAPRFDRIRPEHVEPAMLRLVEQLEAELARVEEEARPTWEGLVEPLERIQDPISLAWRMVAHLMGVKNSEELREAYQRTQPEVVRVSMRAAQSEPVHRALVELRHGAGWEELDGVQRRIVECMIRDVELAGVGLEGEARERFNAIQLELAELATTFSNHVLDATAAFALTLREEGEVEGLPPSLRELASQAAREAGEEGATAEDGPWRITLDVPSFLPFMQHGARRELREELYRAHVTRASSGELDNTPLIERILELRCEMAGILGYSTPAELSLVSKMAPGVEAAEDLMEELRAASWPAAQRELEELRDFARESGAPEADELMNWDLPYWSERLRESRFDYTDEELRPYFPLPRVLEGLFALAHRLFGVEIVPADGEVPVWHEDVRFFRVREEGSRELAAFYLDPYSRPAEKRGGAWMGEVVGRDRLFGDPQHPVRLPVAYLVCNGTPPVNGRPSLMTFHEVETLFHEFGHGLQHMLTRVDHGPAAGISNIEWDAVELPSQFMENWCYHRETLLGLTRHVETGERLPDELFEKLRAARTFQAGGQMLRQVGFSLTDLELHHRWRRGGPESAHELRQRIAESTAVMPPLPEDRFLCAFNHIFSGGYAAGYYSYKWAEVLSADAFAAFEEIGLDDSRAVAELGRRFRETVLALGGSRHPMEVFDALRGRPPSPEALLRHCGLSAPAAQRRPAQSQRGRPRSDARPNHKGGRPRQRPAR